MLALDDSVWVEFDVVLHIWAVFELNCLYKLAANDSMLVIMSSLLNWR
jgi:hypothetical protein